SAVNVGPFALSPEQVGVGVLANLIVFPPTFLMITLFRKARLRTKRPNRIVEALRKQRKNSLIVGQRKANAATDSTTDLMQAKDGSVNDLSSVVAAKKEKKKKAKKGKTLPYWC
ncbi:polycystic kidney disease protein 1 2-like, partial [Tropilaelaps mercedesae]